MSHLQGPSVLFSSANVNAVNLGKSLIMKCESCSPTYFTDVSSLISVANKMAFSLFIAEVFRRFVYHL